MQERLVDIGDWLDINGDTIYSIRRLSTNLVQEEERRSKEEGYEVKIPYTGTGVRYTARGNSLYAICLDWPGKELVLEDTQPEKGPIR
jgi:alpha-L-fucosidase